MTMNSKWSRLWDERVHQFGHTGYGDALFHHYDQPVRLAMVQRIICKLFPEGLGDRVVLDIGCGTGDFIALSLNQGAASVDGVDVSPQALAKAAARFKNDARARLLQGTLIERVTEQSRYDLITSITVLQHHVEEAELNIALGALRDALNPGGHIIVLELAPPLKEEKRQYNQDIPYLVERPPDSWYAAFSAAGLKVVSEPVMPQLGIACLRGMNHFISLVYKPKIDSAPKKEVVKSKKETVSAPVHSLSLKLRMLRASFKWARRIMLWVCYPLDHWLKLPLPMERFRIYRVFVLEKE